MPSPLLAPQALTGTDMAAFAFAFLAALTGALWWRDRERGALWLTVTYLLAAVYLGADPWHRPVGPYPTSPFWSGLGLCGNAALTVGVLEYLRVSVRIPSLWLWALLAPSLLLLAGLMAGLPLTRTVLNNVLIVPYLGLAMVCFWASRRERGAAHEWVALALICIPGAVFVAHQAGVASIQQRYFAVPAQLLLGLAMLTTGLLRRRRALEQEVARRTQAEQALIQLNASLEAQVALRTRDLHNVVLGLEGFNATVSNDLRGPLGGMAGLARAARRALESGDLAAVRQLLPQIARQADNATQQVGALLSLAQVRDATLHVATFDVAAVAEDVLSDLRPALADAGAPLPTTTVHPLPLVRTDRSMVRAIMMGLLGNALKFAKAGQPPQVEIGGFSSEREITVYVRDWGVGFDASLAAQWLSADAVPAQAHTNNDEGRGIGLRVVKRAVERLGGSVWAESTPGSGATFYFTLPLLGEAR